MNTFSLLVSSRHRDSEDLFEIFVLRKFVGKKYVTHLGGGRGGEYISHSQQRHKKVQKRNFLYCILYNSQVHTRGVRYLRITSTFLRQHHRSLPNRIETGEGGASRQDWLKERGSCSSLRLPYQSPSPNLGTGYVPRKKHASTTTLTHELYPTPFSPVALVGCEPLAPQRAQTDPMAFSMQRQIRAPFLYLKKSRNLFHRTELYTEL